MCRAGYAVGADSRYLSPMQETGGSAAIIDPGREIVEAHHHLWPHARMPADWPGSGGGPDGYRLRELYADLCTGHNVVQTVFLQCGASYRAGGPEHLRPVGETEWVAQIARHSQAGPGPEIAGIVAHADLRLGAALEEVLDAHEAAGEGRFCGVRHGLARGSHRAGTARAPGPAPAGLARDEAFRAGVRLLGRRGLPYESWHYHYQMEEFIALARAVPDTVMVLDHFGTPVGVGRYQSRRADVYAQLNREPGGRGRLPERDRQARRPGDVGQRVPVGRTRHTRHRRGTGGGPASPTTCTRSTASGRSVACSRATSRWTGYRSLIATSTTHSSSMVEDFSEADKGALFSGTARRVYRLPSPAALDRRDEILSTM